MRCFFLLLLVFTKITHAYDTLTHSEITNESISISVLQDPELFKNIGLILDAGINEDVFPSLVPTDPNGSDPNKTTFLDKASIVRILTGGSVLEDASTLSVHHFFDPQNGNTGGGIGLSSPDWILESVVAPVTGKEIKVTIAKQNYSYKDVQQYFYHALISPDESTRLTNFGMMFRSLGHVVHHLQDMAQPQHVRSDDHCNATNDFPSLAFFCFLAGKHDPSYYERYTNGRISGLALSTLQSNIPQFSFARDYWKNTDGLGIAEYTSQNFVSNGTNYQSDNDGNLAPHPSFPNPVPLPTIISIKLSELLDEDPVMTVPARQSLLQRLKCTINDNNDCFVDFVQNQVVDNAGPTAMNTKSSTLSIFDEEIRTRNLVVSNNFLSTYATKRIVSLNRFNFESVFPFLLPRAVAYSAGLINHFFRGRLEVVVAETSIDDEVLITVKNSSSTGNVLQNGNFEIYYDAMDGTRKSIFAVSIIGPGLPLNSNETLQLKIIEPDDVNDEAVNPFVLVFNGLNGVIGKEPGITASTFDISPTGIVDRLNMGATECVAFVYGIKIIFDEQPDNNGQVILQGKDSSAEFDFRSIPANVPSLRNLSQWTHKVDEETGKYTYEVTYRYPASNFNPCIQLALPLWISGETVVVKTSED